MYHLQLKTKARLGRGGEGSGRSGRGGDQEKPGGQGWAHFSPASFIDGVSEFWSHFSSWFREGDALINVSVSYKRATLRSSERLMCLSFFENNQLKPALCLEASDVALLPPQVLP